MSLSTQNSPPSSCHHILDRRILPIPPGSIFFENLFQQTAEKSRGNYDLLYQNSILLPVLCNHNNLILKLHQRKIAALMNGGFLYVDSKLEVYQEC